MIQSEAYKKVRDNPTELTKRYGPNVVATTYIRNVYELIHPQDVTPEVAASDMAPALQIGRMDIPPEKEDEFNDWYSNIYVPNYETVPGVIRGRRYRAVSGEPKYLTVYEFENENVSKSTEWDRVRDIDPKTHEIRPHMIHAPGSPGIWKKTFQR